MAMSTTQQLILDKRRAFLAHSWKKWVREKPLVKKIARGLLRDGKSVYNWNCFFECWWAECLREGLHSLFPPPTPREKQNRTK